MAEYFAYEFEDRLPTHDFEQEWDRYEGKPLIAEVIGEAHKVITGIEAFQALPERNQKLVLGMADFAIGSANRIDERWRENYWGLYVVGSRATDESRQDSDLDLLSVGTFYRDQGFRNWRGIGGDESELFEGFDLEVPKELPSEYNMGDVDRKYLVRATPKTEGVLPVDLNVVDLTFSDATLDGFKETMDVAADGGSELSRLPLFELSVTQERHAYRL